MSFVTHPATPALSTPAERKPSLLVRLVRAIVEARTRMYLDRRHGSRRLVGSTRSSNAGPAHDGALSRAIRRQRPSAAGQPHRCVAGTQEREKPCCYPIPRHARRVRLDFCRAWRAPGARCPASGLTGLGEARPSQGPRLGRERLGEVRSSETRSDLLAPPRSAPFRGL